MNYLQAIKFGSYKLKLNNIESHILDSELLLSFVLKSSREQILTNLNSNIKKNNFQKTQLGIRPEFINFSDKGIPVKIKRVSNTGRHKIIDTECSGGTIKVLSNASTEIPSGSAHINFDQKYTYVYGDNWIIE